MALAHSKLTSQGQISVPVAVRKRLGIAPGAVLEWEVEEGKLVVRKAGRYTLDDTRRALRLEAGPAQTSLAALREGIRRRVRGKHAIR